MVGNPPDNAGDKASIPDREDPTCLRVITPEWHLTPIFLPGKILWTEEPGRLQSMGSLRVGHD